MLFYTLRIFKFILNSTDFSYNSLHVFWKSEEIILFFERENRIILGEGITICFYRSID